MDFRANDEETTRLLLLKLPARTIYNRALLAAELVALLTAVVWMVLTIGIGLSTTELAVSGRFSRALSMLISRFFLLVWFIGLCLTATVISRWAASKHKSPVNASLLVFSPIILPVLALGAEQALLVLGKGNPSRVLADSAAPGPPGLGLYLLIGGVTASYLLWKSWWGMFIYLLAKNQDPALLYEKPFQGGQKHTDTDIVQENREYIELKRDVLKERKLRQNGDLPPTNPFVGHASNSTSRSNKPYTRWVSVLVALTIFGGVYALSRPEPASTPPVPAQPRLHFVFSLSSEEESQLQAFVDSYIGQQSTSGGTDELSIVCENAADLEQEIIHRILVDDPPDLALVHIELAKRLASGGHLIELPKTTEEQPKHFMDLTGNRTWRRNLALVAFKDTSYPGAAQRFLQAAAPFFVSRLQ